MHTHEVFPVLTCGHVNAVSEDEGSPVNTNELSANRRKPPTTTLRPLRTNSSLNFSAPLAPRRRAGPSARRSARRRRADPRRRRLFLRFPLAARLFCGNPAADGPSRTVKRAPVIIYRPYVRVAAVFRRRITTWKNPAIRPCTTPPPALSFRFSRNNLRRLRGGGRWKGGRGNGANVMRVVVRLLSLLFIGGLLFDFFFFPRRYPAKLRIHGTLTRIRLGFLFFFCF